MVLPNDRNIIIRQGPGEQAVFPVSYRWESAGVDEMKEMDTVAIGTWPTPEKPHVVRFEDHDREFMKDLTEVVWRHGIKGGRITRIEIDCGMPDPHPDIEIRCFRICVPGPDDRPICTWVCW
jgi:hypothetical protein